MVRLSKRIVQTAFLSLPKLVFLYTYSSLPHEAVLGLIQALLLCHMQHFCRLWMRAAPHCGFAPSRTTCSYLHCCHWVWMQAGLSSVGSSTSPVLGREQGSSGFTLRAGFSWLAKGFLSDISFNILFMLSSLQTE